MEIRLKTKNGEHLINKIFSAVENEEVRTWIVRKDKDNNKYLTHKPEQWCDKVLFALNATIEDVRISINWWKNYEEPDDETKGYCIGRLTELLLVNFKDNYTAFEIIK